VPDEPLVPSVPLVPDEPLVPLVPEVPSCATTATNNSCSDEKFEAPVPDAPINVTGTSQ
jgi:hypothetical protein